MGERPPIWIGLADCIRLLEAMEDPDQTAGDGAVPIASALGAALLGLRQGAGMTYADGATTPRRSVERVLRE